MRVTAQEAPAIDAAQVIADLRELARLTGDERGSQRLCFGETWREPRASMLYPTQRLRQKRGTPSVVHRPVRLGSFAGSGGIVRERQNAPAVASEVASQANAPFLSAERRPFMFNETMRSMVVLGWCVRRGAKRGG